MRNRGLPAVDRGVRVAGARGRRCGRSAAAGGRRSRSVPVVADGGPKRRRLAGRGMHRRTGRFVCDVGAAVGAQEGGATRSAGMQLGRAQARIVLVAARSGDLDRHRNTPHADPTGLPGPPAARHHAPRREVVRLEGRHPGARTDLQAAETTPRDAWRREGCHLKRSARKGVREAVPAFADDASYPNLLGSQGGNTPSGGCFSSFSKIWKRSLRPSLEMARASVAAQGPIGRLVSEAAEATAERKPTEVLASGVENLYGGLRMWALYRTKTKHRFPPTVRREDSSDTVAVESAGAHRRTA